MSKLVQIVDENDQPIGEADMREVLQKDLIFRVVRIMVENKNGQVLLQKRATDSWSYPNCWDNSAAGHVDAGETYEQAAARETAEEIGLENLDLQEIGYYRSRNKYNDFKLNRFNRVYKAIVLNDIKLKLQASEVSDAEWFAVGEIKQLIKNHPDKVTDGLTEVFERYY